MIGGPFVSKANEKEIQNISSHFQEPDNSCRYAAYMHAVKKNSKVPSVTAILPNIGISSEVLTRTMAAMAIFRSVKSMVNAYTR